MNSSSTTEAGYLYKFRLTVHSAKSLIKRDFFKLPHPFAKIVVESTGQCHCTDVVKGTLDPKWNQDINLLLRRNDSVTVSVWDSRKVHKREGAGFLGCVKLSPDHVSRLKDTETQYLSLMKNSQEDDEVRGQVIMTLTSGPTVDDLPKGWAKRRLHGTGIVYYINHYKQSTQWERPTRPGYESVPHPMHTTHTTTTRSINPSPTPPPPQSPPPPTSSTMPLAQSPTHPLMCTLTHTVTFMRPCS